MDAWLSGAEGAREESDGAERPRKAARLSPGGGRDPLVLITWNADGLACRANEANSAEIKAFMDAKQPDVLLVQEVRLKALGKDARGKMKPSEEQASSTLFGRGKAFNGAEYERHLSLADSRSSGTMALVRKGIDHSVHSSWSAALRALDPACPLEEAHHPEGRVQLLAFHSFDLLHTYVPNSGQAAEGLERRRRWDEAVGTFLARRAELTTRPLVWAGDLNVAHTPADSTHERFFRERRTAGFYAEERSRFSALLDTGGLVDVWRELHPASAEAPDPESASYSYRGQLVKPGGRESPFARRGMRLDYFCAPQPFAQDRVQACEILGSGFARTGFLGSDHAPVELTLCPAPA